MKELLRTNDVVRLSWIQALLADAGIRSLVLDQHTSLVEGSIGAIPRRLMVAASDHSRARRLIAEADAGAGASPRMGCRSARTRSSAGGCGCASRSMARGSRSTRYFSAPR